MATLNQFTTLDNEIKLAATKWEIDFPGHTAALNMLREALIAADCAQLQSRTALHQFQSLLDSAGQPSYALAPAILKHLDQLKRRYQIDIRHCTIALQALQTAHAARQSSDTKAARSPVVTAPEPAQPGKFFLQQMATVTVVDGQVRTEADFDAAYWIGKQPHSVHAIFSRRFYFPQSVVPEPYAWVLSHDGVDYEPAPYFVIHYSPDEFARLCHLEVETHSPYLLDGERLYHERFPLTPELQP